MKLGAITFSFLLATGVTGAIAFTGCSGEDPVTPPVVTDSGTDAEVAVDTAPPKDTAPPPPISCQESLPSGFACEEPAAKTGKTVCTDVAIDDIITACFGAASTQTACTAARTKYAACFGCMVNDWLIEGRWIDSPSCIKKVAPTDTCSKTINCNTDCIMAVCSECDETAGTGKKGGDTSEFGDCVSDVQWRGSTARPKGVCYDVATKDYAACAMKETLSICFPSFSNDEALKHFYRGACRDNADWSNVTTDKPVDGGVDGSTDTATADTAAADTAVVDTAVVDTAVVDAVVDTAVIDALSDAATD